MPTAIFIKKTITGEEWNEYYSHNSSYLKLGTSEEGRGRSGGRTTVAFCGYDNLPVGCSFLTNGEARLYQLHCEASHIRPTPFDTEFDRNFNS